jgi:hypothetical protein
MSLYTIIFLSRTLDKIQEFQDLKPRKLYTVDKTKEPYVPRTNLEIVNHKNRLVLLEFTILFFTHILYEDDNKISLFEKREIKKLIKEKEGYLQKNDIKRFHKIISSKPSIMDVIDFAKKYDISFEQVVRIINLFRITSENNTKYSYVLDKIERHFIMEKENF